MAVCVMEVDGLCPNGWDCPHGSHSSERVDAARKAAKEGREWGVLDSWEGAFGFIDGGRAGRVFLHREGMRAGSVIEVGEGVSFLLKHDPSGKGATACDAVGTGRGAGVRTGGAGGAGAGADTGRVKGVVASWDDKQRAGYVRGPGTGLLYCADLTGGVALAPEKAVSFEVKHDKWAKCKVATKVRGPGVVYEGTVLPFEHGADRGHIRCEAVGKAFGGADVVVGPEFLRAVLPGQTVRFRAGVANDAPVVVELERWYSVVEFVDAERGTKNRVTVGEDGKMVWTYHRGMDVWEPRPPTTRVLVRKGEKATELLLPEHRHRITVVAKDAAQVVSWLRVLARRAGVEMRLAAKSPAPTNSSPPSSGSRSSCDAVSQNSSS